MKRTATVVAGMVLTAGLGASIPAPAMAGHGHSTESVFKRAQHLITDQNINVSWDGRYSWHKNFCIETFNGTNKDIKQYGHGVPPGFYLKFCSNGSFHVNDGQPFNGMESY